MNKRKKASSAPKRKAARGTLEMTTEAPPTESTAEPIEEPVVTAASEPETPAAAPTSLTLAAECLVIDASSLKASLSSLLDQPKPVTVDASGLQRIDTAALQVITAFVRERADRGHPVEWQGAAPVLVTAAQLLGLTSLLKLPV
jgi:phospholipid transport system transporter-binding protein